MSCRIYARQEFSLAGSISPECKATATHILLHRNNSCCDVYTVTTIVRCGSGQRFILTYSKYRDINLYCSGQVGWWTAKHIPRYINLSNFDSIMLRCLFSGTYDWVWALNKCALAITLASPDQIETIHSLTIDIASHPRNTLTNSVPHKLCDYQPQHHWYHSKLQINKTHPHIKTR